jgi:hypothetical protein
LQKLAGLSTTIPHLSIIGIFNGRFHILPSAPPILDRHPWSS